MAFFDPEDLVDEPAATGAVPSAKDRETKTSSFFDESDIVPPKDLGEDPSFDPIEHFRQTGDIETAREALTHRYKNPESLLKKTGKFLGGVGSEIGATARDVYKGAGTYFGGEGVGTAQSGLGKLVQGVARGAGNIGVIAADSFELGPFGNIQQKEQGPEGKAASLENAAIVQSAAASGIHEAKNARQFFRNLFGTDKADKNLSPQEIEEVIRSEAALRDVSERIGGGEVIEDLPLGFSGPEGAETIKEGKVINPEDVAIGASVVDPQNIALMQAGNLPGVKQVAGVGLKGAGAVAQGAGSLVQKAAKAGGRVSGRAIPLTTLLAAGTGDLTALGSAIAGRVGSKVVGKAGAALSGAGRVAREAGEELLDPSFVSGAATAAAKEAAGHTATSIPGKALENFIAPQANIAAAGKLARRGLQGAAVGAAGSVPTLPLSESPEAAGAGLVTGAAMGAVGMATDADSRSLDRAPEINRAATRLLAQEGAKIKFRDQTLQPMHEKGSADLLPAEAEHLNALRALVNGFTKGGKPMDLAVLDTDDYAAEYKKRFGEDVDDAGLRASRGFYDPKTGTVLLNKAQGLIAAPHEAGHFITDEVLGVVSQAYGDNLRSAVKEGLFKDGKATPEFQRFIDSYNKHTPGAKIDANAKAEDILQNRAIQEYVAETTREVLGEPAIGRFSLPRDVSDAISDSLVKSFGNSIGRKEGMFDRTALPTIHKAIRDIAFDLRESPGGQRDTSEAAPLDAREGAAVKESASPAPDPETVNRNDRYATLNLDPAAVDALRESAQSEEIDAERRRRGKRPISEKSLNEVAEQAGKEFDERLERYIAALEGEGVPHPEGADLKESLLLNELAPDNNLPKWKKWGVRPGSKPVAAPETAEGSLSAFQEGGGATAPTSAPLATFGDESTATKNETESLSPVATATAEPLKEFGTTPPLPEGLDAGTSKVPTTDQVNEAREKHKEGPIRAAIDAADANRGKVVWIKDYNAARKTSEGFTESERTGEIRSQSASKRKAGEEGTAQDKPFIPTEIRLNKKGDAYINGYDVDVMLSNLRHIVDFARENNVDLPLKTDKEIEQALNSYHWNHANGFDGAGTKALKHPGPEYRLPLAGMDSGPRPLDADPVKAQKIADMLNMAVNSKPKEVGGEEGGKAVALNIKNEGFREGIETNQLRKELTDAGFDVDTNLSKRSAFYGRLSADLMKGGIQTSPEGLSGQSVRPHGFDIDLQKAFEHGKPQFEAVAAGFMPGEAAKPKTESELRRMKAMDLARYADQELGLPERDVWDVRGGPLPKEVLIRSILEKDQSGFFMPGEAGKPLSGFKENESSIGSKVIGKVGTKENPLASFMPTDEVGKFYSKRDEESRFGEGFYSALERVVKDKLPNKFKAEQAWNTIKNAPGIKADELEFTDVEKWLKDQDGTVTKQELLDYLKESNVTVQSTDDTAGSKEEWVLYDSDGSEIERFDDESDAERARERLNDEELSSYLDRNSHYVKEEEVYVVKDADGDESERFDDEYDADNYVEDNSTDDSPLTVETEAVWKVYDSNGDVRKSFDNEDDADSYRERADQMLMDDAPSAYVEQEDVGTEGTTKFGPDSDYADSEYFTTGGKNYKEVRHIAPGKGKTVKKFVVTREYPANPDIARQWQELVAKEERLQRDRYALDTPEAALNRTPEDLQKRQELSDEFHALQREMSEFRGKHLPREIFGDTVAETVVDSEEEANSMAKHLNETTGGIFKAVVKPRVEKKKAKSYTKGHWDEADVVAHTREQDFEGEDGKKVRLIDEFQSDWLQQARDERKEAVERVAKERGISEADADKLVPKNYAFEDSTQFYINSRTGRNRRGPFESREDAEAAIPKTLKEQPATSTDPETWLVKDNNTKEIDLDSDAGPNSYTVTSKDGDYITAIYGTPRQAMDAAMALRESLMNMEISETKKDALPDAPFKQTWAEMAFKKALIRAIDEGKDRIGWTRGIEHVKRYEAGLRKSVDKIEWERSPHEGRVTVKALKDGNTVFQQSVPLEGKTDIDGKKASLKDVVGKDMAKQIKESTEEGGTFEGDELAIGGEGFQGFYDFILPKAIQKIVGKFGGKVTESRIKIDPEEVKRDNRAEMQPIVDRLKEIQAMVFPDEAQRPNLRDLAGVINRNARMGIDMPGLKAADAEAIGLEARDLTNRGIVLEGQTDKVDRTQKIWSVDITPEMAAKIKEEGLPIFMPGDKKSDGKPLSGFEDESSSKSKVPKTDPLGFYSGLRNAVEDKLPNRASAEQILATLDPAKSGVKKEEMDWMGLPEFLKDKKTVTKQELLDFIDSNQVELKEVTYPKQEDKKGKEADRKRLADDVEISEEEGEWFLRDGRGSEEGPFTSQEEAERFGLQYGYDAFNSDQEGKRDEVPAKFSQYQLPGGRNYREVLFTLPEKPDADTPKKVKHPTKEGWALQYPNGDYVRSKDGGASTERTSDPDRASLWDKEEYITHGLKAHDKAQFRSSHWDEPNVIAHIRLADHTDTEGNKVRLIEEAQSDWHQKGRKSGYEKGVTQEERAEYKKLGDITFPNPEQKARLMELDRRINIPGVPDAPFKKTWHELAFKRALRQAVEDGMDKIAWTQGEQQNERYDLSKHVTLASIAKDNSGKYTVYLEGKDGSALFRNTGGFSEHGQKTVTAEELADTVGKEVAQKLLDGVESKPKNEFFDLRGSGLKIGGEGMKGFYDKILPDFVRKYVKKWGGKVEETGLTEVANVDMSADGFADWALEKGIVADKEEAIKAWREAGTANPYVAQFVEANKTKPKYKVHSVTITPAMRESVLSGQPLFMPGEGNKKPLAGFGEEAKKHGSIYQGDRVGGLHEFKEESTGGNFSIKEGEVTPERIKEKADAVRESFEGKNAETESDVDELIRKTKADLGQLMPGDIPFSKERAEDMFKRAWNASVKDYYDDPNDPDDPKTWRQWVEKFDADDIALVIDSDSELYHRFAATLPEDVIMSDVIQAYKDGKLGSGTDPKKERTPALPLADIDFEATDKVGEPTKFEPLPKEKLQPLWETAKTRATKKNTAAIIAARKTILMQSHRQDIAAELGITPSELNKQLKTWSNYPASAKKLTDSVNRGVPEVSKWMGIPNSSFISKANVSHTDVASMVKEIDAPEGSGWYSPTAQSVRQFLARAFLGIDTRIDYSDLTIRVDTKPENYSKKTVRGEYNASNKLLRLKENSAKTMAHEIGHYLDHKWAEESGIGAQMLSDSSINLDILEQNTSKERAQWVKRFMEFVHDLSERSDITSEYTQSRREVFARFLDKFVTWTGKQAGVRDWEESRLDRDDKFRDGDYHAFVKLLQEKAFVDAKDGNPLAWKNKKPDAAMMPGEGEARRTWFVRDGKRIYHKRNPDGKFAPKSLANLSSVDTDKAPDDKPLASFE